MTRQKAVLARDYMTKAVVTLSPDMTLLDAVELLLERRISGAPVVDLTGVFMGDLPQISQRLSGFTFSKPISAYTST